MGLAALAVFIDAGGLFRAPDGAGAVLGLQDKPADLVVSQVLELPDNFKLIPVFFADVGHTRSPFTVHR